MKLHLYSAFFKNKEEAMRYASEMDFDDDESIPELHNAVSGRWLDEDFIETIYGEARFAYIHSVLSQKEDLADIENSCPVEHNTLFLIYEVKGSENEGLSPMKPSIPLYIGSVNAKLLSS